MWHEYVSNLDCSDELPFDYIYHPTKCSQRWTCKDWGRGGYCDRNWSEFRYCVEATTGLVKDYCQVSCNTCSKSFPALSYRHVTSSPLYFWDRKTYNRIMLLTKNFVADCVWSDWNFGPCSSSCGKGTRVGTRIKSIKEDNGGVCNGHSSITWECNGQECPGIPKINWP